MKRSCLPLALCILHCALCIAPAAQLPAPPPAEALVPGPLHSATNLSPAEARAALASALPPPSESAVAAFLAPSEKPMPAFETSSNWVDAVFLPLGYHETETPATVSSPSSIVLCSPDYVRAVVWRYRRGTGPRDVPLDRGHDSITNANFVLLGRVVGAWFDETRGAVARIELTPAGRAAIEARPVRVSAGMRTVAATNAAGDRLAIPWSLRSLALTRDPALPTPWISAGDLRPLSEISVYPRAR